jgi:DNA-binding response OmpR family regulator
MGCCLECGADQPAEVRRGRLAVTLAPPEARLDGERLELPAASARLLHRLVRRGRASHENLGHEMSLDVENARNNVSVRMVYVRRALAGSGLAIRTIWGWGYELVEEGGAEPRRR